LAVNTRDWTFTSEISAMPGTLEKNDYPCDSRFFCNRFDITKGEQKDETIYEIRN